MDADRLAAAAASSGFKLRTVATAAADLLISRPPDSTLAFLLWRRKRGDGGGEGNAVRIARVSASFKQSYVLVPHDLMSEALDAAAR